MESADCLYNIEKFPWFQNIEKLVVIYCLKFIDFDSQFIYFQNSSLTFFISCRLVSFQLAYLNLLNIRSAKHDRPLRKRAEKAAAEQPAASAVIKVDGMMCHHCEASVRKALEALDFIETAEANFETGRVDIKLSGPLDEEKVKAAVEAEDYEYKGISE